LHNQYWLGVWREHSEEYIKRANASWQALADRAEPAIVGPPRPASPPTTKVALRDGGHWVVVAGQVARDAAGNVVGKGDLGTGKNVGACLEAGGATVKDIVFTVSYVKQPAEFGKYADLRERYFGPPSPESTVVAMPQSINPDLLVQVEAFAAIR
jgi:enamine deaminase RidA (YjgF/YER057c/UK114 family)